MADSQPESMKNRKLSLKKMEALVREMQDSETGVPLRRHKLLLTAVPDAMAGYDMIEWLMEHYNLDDSTEAISLALQLCLHCFIYPVTESRDIAVKDDSSIYKFHPESAWPSRGHEPDSRSYAVYLVKKQMRKDKPRLHAIDEWESEEHARLKMNLSAHWSGIVTMAEEQLKLEKNRKKTEKLIAESQERAYWMVYRPPPGAPNRLEVPPYVQLRQPDRISVKKCESELEFLKNHVARSRTKVSQAAQSLIGHTTTYAEFDPFITPPIPSNPWITDDVTYWTLNAELVDIPTERRVKKWALSISDVLKDGTGRREFEKYLQTEYSHENIRFWMACNRLKNAPTSMIGVRAKEIFDEFLAHGAPCEVNIDSKTLDWTVSMLNSQPTPRIIFTKAQLHVFHLLTKDCYPRFVRSEYYKNLLAAAQQAGQRRRMFGFGPSSRKKASGVDGGGGQAGGGGGSSSSSNLQQQGSTSGGGSGGGGAGASSSSGATGAGSGAAGSSSTTLSRNASDKTLKQGAMAGGVAASVTSTATGVGCVASIIDQDRRLSHSHSTSDLRKIDASASLGGDDVCPWEEGPRPGPEKSTTASSKPPPVCRAMTAEEPRRTPPMKTFLSADVCPWDDEPGGQQGPAQTDVCPWDAQDLPSTKGADSDQAATGAGSAVQRASQSPNRQVARTVTPVKGSPRKDDSIGGSSVAGTQPPCDICPWDSADVSKPEASSGSPVPVGRTSNDKRKDFVNQSRQIKSCEVGSRLAPPAPRKPQRNSVAAIETHSGLIGAGVGSGDGSTRTPSIDETDESGGHGGAGGEGGSASNRASGARSLRESSFPESLAEINEEAVDGADSDQALVTGTKVPRPGSGGVQDQHGVVRFRLESDTSESVTPTSAVEKLSSAAQSDVESSLPSAAHTRENLPEGQDMSEEAWREEIDRKIDAIFDEADVDTQLACHLSSGSVHAQCGYSGEMSTYGRSEYRHMQSQELWDAETVPDEFVLEPSGACAFAPFMVPTLERIIEETGSETSSIATDHGTGKAGSLPAPPKDVDRGPPLQPNHHMHSSGPGPAFLGANDDLDPEPTLIMPIDPLPNVPLPHRAGFLGTYAAPMPQPDNTLMVLCKAKEVLERKLMEEAQRQAQRHLLQQQQQEAELHQGQDQAEDIGPDDQHQSQGFLVGCPSGSENKCHMGVCKAVDELHAGFESSSAASSRTANSWDTAGTDPSSTGRVGDVEPSSTTTGSDDSKFPLLPLQQSVASKNQQLLRLAESSTSSEEKMKVSAMVHSTSSSAASSTAGHDGESSATASVTALAGNGSGFDIDHPTSLASLIHGHHPRQDFELYQQALANAVPPPPPEDQRNRLMFPSALGIVAPCSSNVALDKLASPCSFDIAAPLGKLTAVTKPPELTKRLRFEDDPQPDDSPPETASKQILEAASCRSDTLRSRLIRQHHDVPPPLTLPLKCTGPVSIDAPEEDIKFIDESSSEEVGTPVAASDKFEEIKAEFLRRAADPNVRRVLPTDPSLRHVAEALLPTHLRRVTIVESATPSMPEKIVSDIVISGSSMASSSASSVIPVVLTDSASSTATSSVTSCDSRAGSGMLVTSAGDSASQETLVGQETVVYCPPGTGQPPPQSSGTVLDPLDISLDDIKPMEGSDFLLTSLWSGEDMLMGVPPLPDGLSEPDLQVGDIVSVPPPPPRYSESDLELNKTLSQYGGYPCYQLPMPDGSQPQETSDLDGTAASSSSDLLHSPNISAEDQLKTPTNERIDDIPAREEQGSTVATSTSLMPPADTAAMGTGNRTVLGQLPVFGSPLNVGSVSSIPGQDHHEKRRSRDAFGSVDALSEPAFASGSSETKHSSTRRKSARSSSQKERERHRSSSRRKRESCRTETANTPVKPAEICPWENDALIPTWL